MNERKVSPNNFHCSKNLSIYGDIFMSYACYKMLCLLDSETTLLQILIWKETTCCRIWTFDRM